MKHEEKHNEKTEGQQHRIMCPEPISLTGSNGNLGGYAQNHYRTNID
jgi:hypothetical protein